MTPTLTLQKWRSSFKEFLLLTTSKQKSQTLSILSFIHILIKKSIIGQWQCFFFFLFEHWFFSGSLWNEPSAKTCIRQKTPVPGSTYPGGLPPAVAVLKGVLRTIKTPVTLLDITTLSLLRKDGHPSIYGLGGATAMDCSHWCLPGVPDTWNEILYNLIWCLIFHSSFNWGVSQFLYQRK